MQRHSDYELPGGQRSLPAAHHPPALPAQPYYFEPIEGAETASRGEQENLTEYIRLLLRRKGLLAVMAAAGLGLGYLVVLVQTPMYRARTAIEIQSMAETDALYRMVDGDWRGTGTGSQVSAESYLETQLRMLDSKTFQRRVQEKMQSAPRAESTFKMSLPRQILAALGIKGDAPLTPTAPPVSFESRVLENTRIVEVTADSPDPEYAADFANTVASEFIDYNRELQSEAAERTLKWLTDQMASMRYKVEESKNRLEEYSRTSGLQYETERPLAEKEKLRDLEKALEIARQERIHAESVYEAALEEARRNELIDDRMAGFETDLVKKRAELEQLREKYTPQHSEVLKALAEIDMINRLRDKHKESLLATYRRAAEGARLREERLYSATLAQEPIVSDVARKGAEYDMLRGDLERNKKLYDDLLQKATEVSLSTAMRASSQIRIIDGAEPPPAPYRPSPSRLMGLGLASGLFCGIGLVLMRERSDRRIRAPRETESVLPMGIPELAAVPRHAELSRSPNGKRRLLPWAWRNGKAGHTTELIPHEDRSALVAEPFRDAIASILASVGDKKTATRILITSPSHGDGKSTVVANLGMCLADLGYRVLVVDGDLRKPTLNHIADVGNTWGLSTLVSDNADLTTLPVEALCQSTPVEKLSVLTTGPGPKNVFRVLHSPRTTILFDRLSKEFDFILVDTPPALMFSDARLLGRLMDFAILVVKADESKRDDALEAVRRLMHDNIPIMGTILNYWDQKANVYNGYYGYADKRS